MDIKQLNFNDIKPNVRYVNLLQCNPGFIEGPRRIYDHQFVYVHKGRGKVEIAGRTYTAFSGDLFFYEPGTIHAFYADVDEPYLLTGIHFDFTDIHRDRMFPIGPFALQFFNEDLITEKIHFTDFKGFPPHIHISSNSKIREIILDMVHEYEIGKIYSQEYLSGLFQIFLTIVARNIQFDNIESDSKGEVVNSVINFIQEHYYENLTNQLIAQKFHFHPNYLNHIITSYTGMSLRQYLIDFRIRKSLDMLLYTRLTVTEIAKTVGFKDLHYFSRLFKNKTSLSPLQVRSGIC
jgi:AraC-like DNA-binding protein